MIAPGLYSLGDIAITQAAIYVGDWVVGLDGMTGANVQIAMKYGSGTASGTVYLQTSLDGGTTAIDIGAVTIGTISAVSVLNFSGLTPIIADPVTPSDAALTGDTAIDGILGDRLRVKVVTSGTYAGSTVLSGRFIGR